MPEKDNKEPTVQPIRTKAADARTIYVDSTRMARSPWDIRLHFGLLKEAEPGVIHEEEMIVVLMSPQHAKAVLNDLRGTVKKWEDEYGEIALTNKPAEETAKPAEELAKE
jgi:hypothetical protein